MKKRRALLRFVSMLLVVGICAGIPGTLVLADDGGNGFELLEAMYEAGIAPMSDDVLPIYKDRENYSFEERAADLVGRMTLEHKASQMISGFSPAIPELDMDWYGWWNEALHGVSRLQEARNANATTIYNTTSYPISLSMGSTWDPALMYRVASEIGDEAREVVRNNHSELTFWSPTVNLNRDPRWGRSDESFGEDPFHSAAIASQFVNGMEGKTMDGERLDPDGYLKTVTTIKHYLANNSENNRLNGSSNLTERELREYYSYVYRLIIEQSDVSSVMTSYNRVNEVPANLNHYLLDTLLRQTFGFSGYVTSDCDSVWIAYNGNGYDRDPTANSGNGNGHGWRLPDSGEKITDLETIAWAVSAGGDLECNNGYSGSTSVRFDYRYLIPSAVEEEITTPSGLFDENTVDISLHRLMTARMELGEFDDAEGVVTWYNEARARIEDNYGEDWVYSSSANSGAETVTEDRLELVLEAAQKSLVLLKNDPVAGNGEPLLPLQVPDSGDYKVAVIGVFAQPDIQVTNSGESFYMFLGGYSANMGSAANDLMVTPYHGIKDAIQEINPGATVEIFNENHTATRTTAVTPTELTEDVLDFAADADLCIIYVGTDASSANEQSDRVLGLNLPGSQEEWIKDVAEVNDNIVLVMETISPNDVSGYQEKVPAMIWSCYNGMLKGQALADVLLGKVNPSGRTSSVWFKSADQLNNTKSYRLAPGEDVQPYAPNTEFNTNGETHYSFGNSYGRTYMYYDESAGGDLMYPFGYGLSYTTFDFGNLRTDISGGVADPDGTITVTVDVENTGDMDGEEVVQVYVATPGNPDPLAPIKRLVGFQKVFVEAGKTETVNIEISVPNLAFWSEGNNRFELYQGAYRLQVGQNHKDILLTEDFNINAPMTRKISVVTAKPNQEGDTAADIPHRLVFDLDTKVFPQLTVAMSDDTLYGYIMKGQSVDLPSNLSVSYESNRPEVVEVDGDEIKTVGPGVATITATVHDSVSDTSGTCDFVLYVSDAKQRPSLESLKVNGEEVANFSPSWYDYNYMVVEDDGPEDYVVTAVAAEGTEIDEIVQADAIPGAASVTVSNENGTQTYNIYYVLDDIRVESATADNDTGTLTVTMTQWPWSESNQPSADQFYATIALDAFEGSLLTLSNLRYEVANRTLTFDYTPVPRGEEQVQVNISIRYLNTLPVTINYIVTPGGDEPDPDLQIEEVIAFNGELAVTMSGDAGGANLSDFSATIDDEALALTGIRKAGNVVYLKFAPIEQGEEEQTYTIAVSYQGGAAIEAELTVPAEGQVDKQILAQLLQTIDQMDEDAYTEDSWSTLMDVVAEVQVIVDDDEATQDEVNEAVERLRDAIDALKKKDDGGDPDPDKQILAQLLQTIDQMDEDAYTEDSWNALMEVVAEVKDIMDDDEATQDDVNKAVKSLRDAIDALKKKDDGGDPDPGPGPSPRPSGSSSRSGGNGGSSGWSAPSVPPAFSAALAGAATASSNVGSDGTVNQTSIVAEANTALASAIEGGTASVRVRGASSISSAALQALNELANTAGKSLVLYADTMSAQGSAVQGRLFIEPGTVSSDLQLTVHTEGDAVSALKTKFETWFTNKFNVVSLGQKGSFGARVQIAAKVGLSGMDTENLVFYAYDSTSNTYTAIENPNYSIDANGYLRFYTERAGDIIVSEGALVRK